MTRFIFFLRPLHLNEGLKNSESTKLALTDTGEFAPKWTRVFSTRRRVILVARTRRKKEKKILASTLAQIRLWTSFGSSHESVKFQFLLGSKDLKDSESCLPLTSLLSLPDFRGVFSRFTSAFFSSRNFCSIF